MATPVRLPRGGVLLDTPFGAVQLGAPSETLKDTQTRPGGAPRVVLLPPVLVDMRRGVSLCDVEFLVYWQLFGKGRPLVVIGTSDQEPRVRAALEESLFGPEDARHVEDYAAGAVIPNLQREREAFRRNDRARTGRLDLDDALEFHALDGDGVVTLGEGADAVTISGAPTAYRVRFRDADGPHDVTLVPDAPQAADAGSVAAAPASFVPPRFGVTILGRSHGFDPDPAEHTSGFVLWLERRGVLVDPPAHSTRMLARAQVSPALVDAVLLTHCHADHDAGTLQKILEGGRVRLYTSRTIFRSWLRKWSALTGLTAAALQALVDFRPVTIGAAVDVNGAKLLFRHTLHSIPTLGFEAHCAGRSMNYSSDTLNDPLQIEALFQDGHLDAARRDELLHFDWSHDLVLHESGVPPLHTPLSVLTALPVDVRQRLRVVHMSPARLPPGAGVVLAEPGFQHTIDLAADDVRDGAPDDGRQRALRNLTLLGRASVFSSLPFSRAADLLAAAEEVEVASGTTFIHRGETGGALFLVTAGKASVRRGGHELKVYGAGDVIGETAVLLQRPRNADVVALTDLALLRIDGAAARRACRGTAIAAAVRRQATVREQGAWELLEAVPLFASMSPTQKNDVEAMLRPARAAAGAWLVPAGKRLTTFFLVVDGEARVGAASHGRGALLGDVEAWWRQVPEPLGARAHVAVRGFRLRANDLRRFLQNNPGVLMRIEAAGTAPPTSLWSAGVMVDLMADLAEPDRPSSPQAALPGATPTL